MIIGILRNFQSILTLKRGKILAKFQEEKRRGLLIAKVSTSHPLQERNRQDHKRPPNGFFFPAYL
jgi:hypothetical protein